MSVPRTPSTCATGSDASVIRRAGAGFGGEGRARARGGDRGVRPEAGAAPARRHGRAARVRTGRHAVPDREPRAVDRRRLPAVEADVRADLEPGARGQASWTRLAHAARARDGAR